MEKLESKLKMMEIAFEQINNSRNDLIKQLADCEMEYVKLQEENDSLGSELQEATHREHNLKQKLEKIRVNVKCVDPDGERIREQIKKILEEI